MAGHSHYSNIKYQKDANDKRRARYFTQAIRLIANAAKSGSDPQINHKLQQAISSAKRLNLPKEKIEAAISRANASAGQGHEYHEVRYEGYGLGGTAFIIDVLTDNKNRIASEIRTIFNKNAISLAEPNSVAFQFHKVGLITIHKDEATQVNFDELFEIAIEIGAEDCKISGDEYEIISPAIDLHDHSEALEGKLGITVESKITWIPNNTVVIQNLEEARKIMKFINAIYENDEVQDVFVNFEIPDELL